MAIEASLSRFKKQNLCIFIGVLTLAAIWFCYDGYLNEKFINEHKGADGKPDSTLVFNQKSPPYFIAGAILLGIYFFTIRNTKIVADETQLIINTREKIPYDSIQKVDKTHFGSKGYFIITFKDQTGKEVNRRVSEKTYDNLTAILDILVVKIS